MPCLIGRAFFNLFQYDYKNNGTPKLIALVAMIIKKELIEWAVFNKTTLAKHRLYATGTTGGLLEEKLDQSITKLQSGP
jgi:methylglyoxal synthase